MESNLEKAVQQAQQEANRAQQLLNEKQKEASVQIHSLQDQLKKVLWDFTEGLCICDSEQSTISMMNSENPLR